jgi:hypothetical protein
MMRAATESLESGVPGFCMNLGGAGIASMANLAGLAPTLPSSLKTSFLHSFSRC